MSVVNQLEKKKINRFYKTVNKFCKERNIKPSLKNFLNYDIGPFGVGESYKYLSNAPMTMLACSRSFNEYLKTLDKDFKKEFDGIKTHKLMVISNPELREFLKKLMNDDFCAGDK